MGWVPLENQTPCATRQLHKGFTVHQLSLEKLKILLKDELLAREPRGMHKSGLKKFGNCGIIFMPLCWSAFVTDGETEAGEVIHCIRAELGLIPHVQVCSSQDSTSPKAQSGGTETEKNLCHADKVWDKMV